MIGRTTERFCFRDRTSPSSTSNSSVPTNIDVVPADDGGRARSARPPTSSLARLLAELVRLDHVTDLDVGELAERETAFEALADLHDVVLEPPQRADREVLPDNHAVTQQACLGVTPDLTRRDQATGDGADLRGLEHLTDLSPTEVDLLVHRLEHALQGLLDLLDRLVDHRVVPDVDTLARGAFGRLALRTHVVPDHDRVGRRGEVDVALGDTTHTAVDDVELHLVADVDLHQGRFERLDGTRVVALDDQVEGVGLLQRGVQVLQADTLAPGGVLGVADPSLAALGDLPGHPVLLDDEERVTGPRHRCEADDLDRPRRLRLGDVPVVLVHHASHSTVGVARDDRVAHSQGSALHQH